MTVNGKRKKDAVGRGSEPKRSNRNSVVWYNPQPNNEDVAWLDSKGDNFASNVVELVEGLSDVQRLSVRLDAQSGRWLAILFDDTDAGDGTVHALSVRGATAFFAVVLLHYFHYVKFNGDWRTDSAEFSGKFG